MQFEHWKALKAQIISETADVVNGMYAPANFSVEEAAEVFRKVLEYPINQPELKLDGLPNLLPALYELLVKEAMNKNIEQDGNFTLLATHFESYLKKIMYLINHPDNPAINPVLALAPCISKLGLNPNKINYNQTDLSPNSKNNFAEHLWRAYNIRNDEAHYYPPKNRKQFWTAVQSYLVMYLYAAFKYRQAILQAVEPYFLTTYLQNYLTAYQNWNNEYVAIPGIEFVKIEQWVTEVPDTERDNRGETNPDAHPKPPAENRPQPTQERRSGTIEELSKTIAERQMVLVAEPGMGKTTALQYLAFLNAQNIENGDNQTPYPVMIELKEFQK
ncbi:MAG TPA: hypothetical protein PK715_17425, partial [Chitinophagales bacterium]|nr:hypothetical protein [Chitinophagales bacterium]